MTNTSLVLVRPLGFSTASRHLKRAGLDYWDDVVIEEINDLETYLKGNPFSFQVKLQNPTQKHLLRVILF